MTSLRRRALPPLVAAVAVALLTAPGAARAAVMAAEGFHDRPLVSGLNQPTALAYAPDGRMFIAEKAGRVRVVTAAGRLEREPLLDLGEQINAYQDRGLLGIAVRAVAEPSGTLELYLLYVREVPGGQDDSGPTSSRLSRVIVREDGTVGELEHVLGTEPSAVCPPPGPSVDCLPNEEPIHAIGTVRVDLDGTLWVGVGDGASSIFADERALRAGDIDTMAGKLLHVDRDGKGLPGHPFCPEEDDLAKACTKVHAKGFRNPFRFTLRADGVPLVGDVGWTSREELDLAEGGRDYGWPCREGTIATPGYSGFPRCSTTPATSFAPPAYDYGAVRGGSVIAGPFYDGTAYPAGYRGDVFFGDYAQRFVKRMTLAADGGVVAVRDFAEDLGPVSLDTAQNGDLLYIDMGDGGPTDGVVRRIVYSPGNAPPVASAVATPAAGGFPLTVALSAEGSTDPDGDALSYTWDFGDGATASGRDVSHTFAARGSYLVRVTVRDPEGLEDVASVWVDAGNAPPALTLDLPARVRGGTIAPVRATALDDQEDVVTPTLSVMLIHGDHRHPLLEREGGELELQVPGDHDADSWFEVTARASDRHGRESVLTERLDLDAVALTLRSVPAGAPLSYAGEQFTADRTRPAAVGLRTTVGAAERFERDGRAYRFARWSDGGAVVHDITVPSTPATLVAEYEYEDEPLAEALPATVAATFARSRSVPRAPRLTWRRPARGARLLTGTVAGLPAGAALEVALARRGGERCRWWRFDRGRHGKARRRCDRARGWRRVRLVGRDRWSVRLGGPLPSSRRLILRARAVAGPRAARVRTRRSPVKAAPATR